jgi:hypothetical protein
LKECIRMNFNFNSETNWTVFTNNPAFMQKVVDDAFKSEGRGVAPKIQFAGKTEFGFSAFIVDAGGFIRIKRKIKFRCANQKHSVVIFPDFVGSKNQNFKDTFSNCVGNWAWNV